MSLDTWIYAKPAEWDALITGSGEDAIPFSYVHQMAQTGYWNDYIGGFQVYNVLGSQAEIQAIIDALPTPPAHVFSWVQGNGTDSLEVNPTIPAEVLAVMKDHKNYDENGDPLPDTPVSLTDPNWGHVFFGQKTRIFAGAFSAAFSGAYK